MTPDESQELATLREENIRLRHELEQAHAAIENQSLGDAAYYNILLSRLVTDPRFGPEAHKQVQKATDHLVSTVPPSGEDQYQCPHCDSICCKQEIKAHALVESYKRILSHPSEFGVSDLSQ